MGRRRKHDTHLPKRVYERRGKFYFDSPVTKKWVPLGDELEAALAKYARMVGPWHGRTIGDTIDRYRTMVLPLKRGEQTRKDEARMLARLKAVFGAMTQDAVTHQHLYRYIDQRTDERPKFKGQPAPSAARHEIALLGLVFAKGIRWGCATTNVVRSIEWDKAAREEPRYVPDELYMPVYSLANVRMQIAMDLARNIAQRRGDLLKITLSDLTDEGILIPQGKSGAMVLVEWTDELRAIAGRATSLSPDIPKEYLLRKRNGRPYTARGFSAIWQRLMRKAIRKGAITAEQRFTFHDLRRKAAREKESLEAAQKLLGHASPETTRRHYRGSRELVRAKPVK